MALTAKQLAELLSETAARHHDAYRATDGYDPSWPEWYAEHLYQHLKDRIEPAPSQQKLESLLRSADEAFTADGLPFDEWPSYYAEFFLARL
ncbi:MAG: hypothetical protein ACE5MI_03225 [Acidimicrobiia bacterium]